MGALIGAGIGAVGSIASGAIGANAKKKAQQEQKSIINQSVLKQGKNITLAYGKAEPLLAAQFKDSQASAQKMRGALGGAQDQVARSADRRAKQLQDQTDVNARDSGLEFSSALDSAKRAIGGDVNRSLLDLELALADNVANVEAAANSQVASARASLAQLALGKSQAKNDVQQKKLALLMGNQQSSTAPAPDFSGLISGLFGVPTSKQLEGGLIGSFFGGGGNNNSTNGGKSSGFVSGWGGYIHSPSN